MKTVEKVLSVLDATSGFKHIKLDEKRSEHLTHNLGDISTSGCHLVFTQPLSSSSDSSL